MSLSGPTCDAASCNFPNSSGATKERTNGRTGSLTREEFWNLPIDTSAGCLPLPPGFLPTLFSIFRSSGMDDWFNWTGCAWCRCDGMSGDHPVVCSIPAWIQIECRFRNSLLAAHLESDIYVSKQTHKFHLSTNLAPDWEIFDDQCPPGWHAFSPVAYVVQG